jgi:ABC-type thiamine transport system ATPase subunit
VEYFALLKEMPREKVPAAVTRAIDRVGLAFRALLREIGQQSTVVVCTHLVEDVGAASTQVALMLAGRVVFSGTPDELAARGSYHAAGDAPLERGYSAVLAAARS